VVHVRSLAVRATNRFRKKSVALRRPRKRLHSERCFRLECETCYMRVGPAYLTFIVGVKIGYLTFVVGV
jgi:hypothetical protein